jgi:hypothetical protein
MIQVLISPNSVGLHMRAGDIVCAGLVGTLPTRYSLHKSLSALAREVEAIKRATRLLTASRRA